MRAMVLFLFLTCAFSVHAEDHKIVDQHTYKDAKFNCSVAELSKSEERKNLTIETENQTGYFELPGVNFMVKVDVGSHCGIGFKQARKANWGGRGSELVKLDVLHGIKGNPVYIWDTATCPAEGVLQIYLPKLKSETYAALQTREG